MWHVSSCSGVATLRTAMHLLLTYLLIRVKSQRGTPGLDERDDLRVRLGDDVLVVDHHDPVADLQSRQTRRSAVFHVLDKDRLHRRRRLTRRPAAAAGGGLGSAAHVCKQQQTQSDAAVLDRVAAAW